MSRGPNPNNPRLNSIRGKSSHFEGGQGALAPGMRVDKPRRRVTRPRPPQQAKPGLTWGDPHQKRRRGPQPRGGAETRPHSRRTRAPPSLPRSHAGRAHTPARPPRPARPGSHPGSPALAGSGAAGAQPGPPLGGRPGPLRAHSRRRAAGPGPLGTILPAAPGAASGPAGPARGPEASPAHAAQTRDRLSAAAVVSG